MKYGLWHALEALGEGLPPSALLSEWARFANGDFPALKPFLRLTNKLAVMHACPQERDCGCVHEVEPEYLFSRCDCGYCEPVRMTPTDLILHELDVAGLGGAVAEALGLERSDNATAFRAAPKCWPAGIHGATRLPVYLALCAREGQLLANLEGLASVRRGPFILLAPTANVQSEIVGAWLERQGCAFIPLASHVSVTGGRLEMTVPVQPILERFAAGLPGTQKPVAEVKPAKSLVAGEVGRLRWDNDFNDVYVDGIHYELTTREGARYCIRYLVMMEAFDKTSARHIEDEINKYVIKQAKREVIKPGTDGNLRIQRYFNGPGNYPRLCKSLVRAVGRNRCFYLQV